MADCSRAIASAGRFGEKVPRQFALLAELMWFLLQALIFFAAMASNIAWHWAPNPYVAALIGVGTGIHYLAAVLRRSRRP
jgi:hypothetical protein